MCRFLLAEARSPEGVEAIRGLLRPFYRAAEYDPLLESYTRGRAWSHCDGHGYALIADYGQGWTVSYYRHDSWRPGVGEEEVCRENLEALRSTVERLDRALRGAERAYLLLHARKASPGMPRGTVHTHPYHLSVPTAGGWPMELFLAHNGSLDRTVLAGELGVENPENYTDTYLLTVWIADRVRRGERLQDALIGGRKYRRTAYIVALLTLEHYRGEPTPRVYYDRFLGGKWELSEAARSYYLPSILEGEGARAVVSPTVAQYAREEGIVGRTAPLRDIVEDEE